MDEIANPWTNFTHIGIVVKDIDKAIAQYEGLGLGPFTRFDFPNPEFLKFKVLRHFGKDAFDNSYKVAWGKFGDVALEIFQPLAGDSIPMRVLNTTGEGVWHYGYDVEDMAETEAFMKARGYEIVGESETEQGVRMCFFGLPEGGVMFQAHEVPPTSNMYEKLNANA